VRQPPGISYIISNIILSPFSLMFSEHQASANLLLILLFFVLAVLSVLLLVLLVLLILLLVLVLVVLSVLLILHFKLRSPPTSFFASVGRRNTVCFPSLFRRCNHISITL